MADEQGMSTKSWFDVFRRNSNNFPVLGNNEESVFLSLFLYEFLDGLFPSLKYFFF